MKRLAIFMTGAVLLSFTALIPMSTAALADSRAITFEPPTYSTSTGVPTGSIQGQDGWGGQTPPGIPINPAYDQAVVATGLTGSTQAFRMSNAVTSGSFGDWPFSPSLTNEAGETSAANDGFSGGTRQHSFQASFDFASTVPGAEQPGLQVSIAPDRGDGARMSFLKIRDTDTGLAVDFADYQSDGTGCGDHFVTTTVANSLNRSSVHTIKLSMDFLNGSANDIVYVFVDGVLVHTGTSWEDYYRECETNPTRTVDSLIFQARTQYDANDIPESPTLWTANTGKGFLFDNLNYSSGPGACTPTGFFRDGINLTAAQIGGNVTGTLDATGCNIGVYYDSTHTGNVTNADVFGANYYGVVVRGTTVNVTGSQIHNIGEVPLNGAQHGTAIYYATVNVGSASAQPSCITGSTTGTVSGNTVSSYQKGGITASCAGTKVTITDNVVTGEGPVNYIAQNGIQVSFGASAKLVGNNVSLNNYSPPKVVACGLLIYKAGGVSGATKSGLSFIKADNNFHDNEENICNFGKGGTFSPTA